jgi:hypothetical protein
MPFLPIPQWGWFDVRDPAPMSQNTMHAPIAMAHACLGILCDALRHNRLPMPVPFVVAGRGIHCLNPAGAAKELMQ